MKIQLFADEPYYQSFSDYFLSHETIELVTESADIIFDATFLNPYKNLERWINYTFPVPIICNTLTQSATGIQREMKNGIVIGMPILPHYFGRQKSVEFSLPINIPNIPAAFHDFVDGLGKTGEQVSDAIAGVFPRTLAMIINEAAFAVQESVATPQDIDTAMKLGTNYPIGPLAWCDEIGGAAIVAILDALAREYGSERYRAAALLRRHAESGRKFIP